MKFAIFGLSASVDIRPLPGAWVAELLGVILGGPGPIKGEISHQKHLHVWQLKYDSRNSDFLY